MVDNSYLIWSCTVPPFKDGVKYDHVRFHWQIGNQLNMYKLMIGTLEIVLDYFLERG